jgi:hypothetical protein
MNTPDDQLPEEASAPRTAPELPSYSLDDVNAPAGWRMWLHGWRRGVVLSLLLAAIVVGFGAKPIYREAKARRALTITEQAGAALDRGQAAEASTLLRQAALMAFQDERVADRVTYQAARGGDMASVAELGKKISGGKAAADEVLIYGEKSLQAGKQEDAARALTLLPSTIAPPDEARRAYLRAGLAAVQGRGAEAKEILAAAISSLPSKDGDSLRVTLAGALLSEEGGDKAQARALLEEASANPAQPGASALRLLAASSAGLSPAAQKSINELADRLRKHPSSTAADELLIARLIVSSDASRRNEAVAQLLEHLRTRKAPDDARLASARWLIGLQGYEEALQLATEDDAAVHAGALMVRLDALSGLERWDDTAALIEKNQGGTLPDTLYHLFRARIASVRGESEMAEAEKRQLRQLLPFGESPHVLFVARYAESVGWKPEAFAAWRCLEANEGARVEALRGQLRNIAANAPAADGIKITRNLLQLQPNDPSSQLSAAYFELLAGVNIQEASAVAEKFLAAQPDSPDLQRVAALARLRNARAGDGLAIWPGDGDENRWRVLHSALLRATGNTSDADKIAAQLGREALSPHEREMLAGKEPAGE